MGARHRRGIPQGGAAIAASRLSRPWGTLSAPCSEGVVMTGILNVCKVIVAIIGTIVTIVATIIGGLWTYSRFIAEDLPALALRPKMDGKVVWYERSNSDECIAEFNIKLENIGKSAIKLTEASVGAWPLDIPPLAGRKIDYVDVDPVGKIKGIAPIVKGNIL